jgi:hypothetical protein
MTIEQWYASSLLDWSRRRDQIGIIYSTMVYSDLNAAEKVIIARCFFVPIELRVGNGTFTEAEDIANWNYLLVETKDSRFNCVEAMRLYVGGLLRLEFMTLSNTQDFMFVVLDKTNLFIETNSSALIDWLNNESGSVYEFAGFKNTAFWSDTIQTQLVAIYGGDF